MSGRGIFFDAEYAHAAAARLRAGGFGAEVAREQYAGENDDEDHAWSLTSDAPDAALELLVDEYDGWLDRPMSPAAEPLVLPSSPQRRHRPPGGEPRVSGT